MYGAGPSSNEHPGQYLSPGGVYLCKIKEITSIKDQPAVMVEITAEEGEDAGKLAGKTVGPFLADGSLTRCSEELKEEIGGDGEASITEKDENFPQEVDVIVEDVIADIIVC